MGQQGKIFGAGNMLLWLSSLVSKFSGDNVYRHKRINNISIYCVISRVYYHTIKADSQRRLTRLG